MNTNDLNTALYEKMAAEQDKYRDWLKSQPPEEILHHTYEYTVREDIVMAMEDLELTDAQAQALCLPGDVSSAGDKPDGREGGLARGWVWATPVLHPALHKGLVPVGLGAPKMMVIVGGHQGEGTYRPQLVEPVEQTDGIRSAGDRTDHGTPRRQHIIFVYEPIHGTVRALIHNQYS